MTEGSNPVNPPTNPCWKSEGGACCCNCRHLAADHSHPGTDGKRVTHRRGYVCLAPEFDCVFSGWHRHGLCEMWDPKTRRRAIRSAVNDALGDHR